MHTVRAMQYTSHRIHRAKLGNCGEWIAMCFLHDHGYEIWETNVRLGRDEIDIIAFDPDDQVVVFAEVKTRTTAAVASLMLGSRKKEKMRRSARRWIAHYGYCGGYRIDLLCVRDGKVFLHCKQLAWE